MTRPGNSPEFMKYLNAVYDEAFRRHMTMFANEKPRVVDWDVTTDTVRPVTQKEYDKLKLLVSAQDLATTFLLLAASEEGEKAVYYMRKLLRELKGGSSDATT